MNTFREMINRPLLMDRNKSLEETVYDKDFETAFLKVCSELYEKKTKPYLLLATEVGNMYTASVYSCLVSYLMT